MTVIVMPRIALQNDAYSYKVLGGPALGSFTATRKLNGATIAPIALTALDSYGNAESTDYSPSGTLDYVFTFSNGEILYRSVQIVVNLEFIWKTQYGSSQSRKAEVYKIKLGDGYEQRARKGINNLTDSWDVSISNATADTVREINDFLEKRGGVDAFLWRDPDGNVIRVTCEEWTRQVQDEEVQTFKAKFLRAYL